MRMLGFLVVGHSTGAGGGMGSRYARSARRDLSATLLFGNVRRHNGNAPQCGAFFSSTNFAGNQRWPTPM
jgi:hypothetical protein